MKKIYFYLASDTLVYLSERIIKNLYEENDVTILIPQHIQENAEEAIRKILPGIKFKYFTIIDFIKNQPDCVVLGNDWANEAKVIIKLSRNLNIVTYCIQESIIDFGDGSGKLEYADYIFIQGEQTLEHLKRENLILSGNPRYEDLNVVEIKKRSVLINCNFTYGIFEEVRDEWLSDIVKACQTVSIEFKISQHPRDLADLTKYKNNLINSSAGTIKSQLIDSSIVITRFSSIIHEALLLGRKVIYYNPHGEEMFYDFQPDGRTLFLATNYNQLVKAINIANYENINLNVLDSYLKRHVRPSSNMPSTIVSEFIKTNTEYKKSDKGIGTLKVFGSHFKSKLKFHLSKLGNNQQQRF